MTNSRIPLFLKQLQTHRLQGAIISNPHNIFYLTGIKSTHKDNKEVFLFISNHDSLIYHSPLLNIPPSVDLPKLVMSNNHLKQRLKTLYSNKCNIYIEHSSLSLADYHRIKKLIPHSKFISTPFLIEDLRMVKDKSEINYINKAITITKIVMRKTISYIKSTNKHISEFELSRYIEDQLYQNNATGISFPTHVAFNSNTAFPHHQPQSNTNLDKDAIVMLDFGAEYLGYKADMTRTFCLSPTPSVQFNQIKLVVDQAYQATTNVIASMSATQARQSPKTVTSSDLDQAARSIIQTAGYSDYFIHSTGHGLGLSIHEAPSISPQNETLLKPGMVITIEPGIYLPHKFGYRHEDTIIIN